MNSARDAMQDELGTELLSQLAPSEQQEVLRWVRSPDLYSIINEYNSGSW